MLYKILSVPLWEDALAAGRLKGAPIDHRDGFIHLSDAAQVAETARLHFKGQRDLMLLAIDEGRLGPALRREASRGGALFPHLYGVLPLDAVVAAEPLETDDAGVFAFPEGPAFAGIVR